MATKKDENKGYIAMLLIAVIAIVALVYLMQRPDEPTTDLGRAVDEIGEGLENAGEELDPNRTTGERVGDTIEDFGDDVQDATRQ